MFRLYPDMRIGAYGMIPKLIVTASQVDARPLEILPNRDLAVAIKPQIGL